MATNFFRNTVSKKKIRYKDKDFDLDLVYVTENIIAMGYPAENASIESIYRNRMDHVVSFLNSKHGSLFKVYNLCQKRSYSHGRFEDRVAKYPFNDHCPPSFSQILAFCQDVQDWLSRSPAHVVAIHCKAGKGRTGVMICCYLLYSRHQLSAANAISFYGRKRSRDSCGVTIPSQKLYIHYFDEFLKRKLVYDPGILLRLPCITFENVPASFQEQGPSSGSLTFEIFANGKKMYECPKDWPLCPSTTSGNDPCGPAALKGGGGGFGGNLDQVERQKLEMFLGSSGPLLTGDVKMVFYHKSIIQKEKVFQLFFNTFFVRALKAGPGRHGLDNSSSQKISLAPNHSDPPSGLANQSPRTKSGLHYGAAGDGDRGPLPRNYSEIVMNSDSRSRSDSSTASSSGFCLFPPKGPCGDSHSAPSLPTKGQGIDEEGSGKRLGHSREPQFEAFYRKGFSQHTGPHENGDKVETGRSISVDGCSGRTKDEQGVSAGSYLASLWTTASNELIFCLQELDLKSRRRFTNKFSPNFKVKLHFETPQQSTTCATANGRSATPLINNTNGQPCFAEEGVRVVGPVGGASPVPPSKSPLQNHSVTVCDISKSGPNSSPSAPPASPGKSKSSKSATPSSGALATHAKSSHQEPTHVTGKDTTTRLNTEERSFPSPGSYFIKHQSYPDCLEGSNAKGHQRSPVCGILEEVCVSLGGAASSGSSSEDSEEDDDGATPLAVFDDPPVTNPRSPFSLAFLNSATPRKGSAGSSGSGLTHLSDLVARKKSSDPSGGVSCSAERSVQEAPCCSSISSARRSSFPMHAFLSRTFGSPEKSPVSGGSCAVGKSKPQLSNKKPPVVRNLQLTTEECEDKVAMLSPSKSPKAPGDKSNSCREKK